MKTSFNLDDYKGKCVMHCKTEEEANSFLEFLHDSGRTWCTGDRYIGGNLYGVNKHNTVYYFNKGTYGSYNSAYQAGYTILEWSDFIVDEDEYEMSDEEFHDMLSELLCI